MGWNKNRGLGAAAFCQSQNNLWVVLAGKSRVQAALQKDEAGSAEQKAFVRGELVRNLWWESRDAYTGALGMKKEEELLGQNSQGWWQ